jgi:hypothetical protein
MHIKNKYIYQIIKTKQSEKKHRLREVLMESLFFHTCGVTTIILLDQDFQGLGGKNKEFLSYISKKSDGVAT